MMMDCEPRPQQVGEILVQVQEDLHHLKEKLLAQGDGKEVDLAQLQNAISKTEDGIRKRTEIVLNQINRQVITLPSLEAQQQQYHQRTHENPPVTMESTFDLKAGMGLKKPTSYDTRNVPLSLGLNRVPSKQQQSIQMTGLTPGQMARHLWSIRAIGNPQNVCNRQVLNDQYGIQLPLLPQKTQSKHSQKVVLGTTVEPLTVLPKANRVDNQLEPPPISEEDARRGILSLLERGLIPPASELTLDPSPVGHKLVKLHEPQEKEFNRFKPITDMANNLAGVKLDVSSRPGQKEDYGDIVRIPVVPPRLTPTPETRAMSGRTNCSSKTAKTSATLKTFDMPLQPVISLPCLPEIKQPPPTTPAVDDDCKSAAHRFAIQHGRTRDEAADFLAFKQHYCLTWGSIVTMIKYLERMLSNYAVPVAFVNGDRLADLALEFELENAPEIDNLLTVILNREDVEAMIRKPGRRFKGTNGVSLAAARIQSTWRKYVARKQYLEYRKKKWAAGVIAISWIMSIKMAKVRKQLKITRADQLEAFKSRTKKLSASWDRIKNSRRVIIHIPSLGLNQSIRDSINDFNVRQNTQMSRLCDIKDPNVDVIFISPVPMNDETLQYYNKLIGLKTAIDSGNVDDQSDLSDRYRIIVPEAIKSFPAHRMCLSTILKYSPRTLKRVKNLIRGRDAYIVTGAPHKDDLYLSDHLDVPLLSPEPDIAHLYSTKSGSKRIFSSAKADMPPSEYDVYSLQQLEECLAQLVTENLLVHRWLFKLDNEFDGRGIAYCDIAAHLRCYKWALKESRRYGEKWNKKWAQEAAYIKIHAEIPAILKTFAKPVNDKLFPSWEKFLEAFLGQGGVIEACPPAESMTAISVDMLIEPNGEITMVCCGDQIHAETPFACWGVSVPQASVEPDILNDTCKRIGMACKSRGVMGYFSVDFVTFIDSQTMEQKLWAIDLSLMYSDSLAMFRLMEFVSQGVLNTKTHVFDVPTPKETKPKKKRILEGMCEEPPKNTNRYGVMSARLLHTNLAVVHYSVYFQMCRAHGIGFDIQEKQGTVFTLVDSFNREKLGML
ncbi:IQ domain-containing protein H-like isoform X2 [Liolophura sinensis]